MTTITQNIADIAGADDNTSWTFYVKEIRESDSGTAIITTKKVRKYPVDGVLTVELDPGPAVVLAADGKHYGFDVPEDDSDLWSLIQLAINIPPETPHQLVVDAVNAYLESNGAPFGVSLLESVNAAAARALLNAVSRDSLVFNVLDHGVVHDGATDCTTALAALVDIVVAAGGGTIFFPPNTPTDQYVGSLVIDANVPIKVLGYGASLVGPSGGATVTINTGVTGASGQTVEIEGLVIKGNADQTTDGLLVRDTSRAATRNVQIVRVNNGVLIQNATAGQNSEATSLRSTLISNSITGVKFDITSGGPSFDETLFDDLEISTCTTGIYLPTGADLVRCRFDATVWVGRSGSTDGVAMYTDANMTRVWGRLGGELSSVATSCSGLKIGPNASGFDQADLQLHFNGSINPHVDLSSATSGQVVLWREGLAHRFIPKTTPGSNMVGPHMQSLADTFPRVGFSGGSAANAPMPSGRDGIFFGPGNAVADTVLFRVAANVLEQGFDDVFKTGQNTTGNRPNAVTVGQGGQFYDTTIKRPIWSDGTDHITFTPDVQTFTASGTWTKPPGAKVVEVHIVGPGGGGGSGAREPSGTVAAGGGGGASGGVSRGTFRASDLTATVAITIGTGAPGGAARTTDATAGAAGGGAHVSSTFGAYLTAGRGTSGGGGGAGVAGTAGVSGYGVSNGANGGASSATGAAGTGGSNGATSGGGAGGGVTTAPAATAGGAGGASAGGAGGAAGTAPAGAGGAGTATPLYGVGAGGGGGATAAAAGDGASGTIPGGGGGGGGGSLNGFNSGAGGAGGNGIAIITTYF